MRSFVYVGIICFLSCAFALEFDRTIPVACEPSFDVSSSALYNVAFEWTKHAAIDTWQYEELGNSCVRARYSTQVRLHKIFENILPTRILKTKVDKMVCLKADIMEETVVLSDILFIETLKMDFHIAIDRTTRALSMSVRSNFSTPWFLKLLESTIVGELKQSLKEYHELLATSVCHA